MTRDGGPVWVGLLDLDGDRPVTGAIGPVRAEHQRARVLVRMHRAPVGLVWVPTMPVETLTERARTAAGSELAEVLRRHAGLDEESQGRDSLDCWEPWMACPSHFPAHGRDGISVIVCTRNRSALLPYSLRSLQQVAYDPMEILVVDNAPRDGASRQLVAELAAEDPRIRYACEPRPGKSMALNQGLAQAKFDLVAVTDDDTLADSGWLAAIAAAFAADPDTVCVTGMVVSGVLDTGAERYFDARYSWGEGFQPRRYDLATHRHPSHFYPFAAGVFGTGANCAFRRGAVLQIGGFDPLLGAGSPRKGGADLDMFLRIILAGGRISYLPAALVWHRHRADLRSLAEQLYAYGHGLGAYLAKHLSNQELRSALYGYGLRHVGMALARQRRAAQSGQLGVEGKWLALYEACGIAPGAVRYWLAARHATGPPGGRSYVLRRQRGRE